MGGKKKDKLYRKTVRAIGTGWVRREDASAEDSGRAGPGVGEQQIGGQPLVWTARLLCTPRGMASAEHLRSSFLGLKAVRRLGKWVRGIETGRKMGATGQQEQMHCTQGLGMRLPDPQQP